MEDNLCLIMVKWSPEDQNLMPCLVDHCLMFRNGE
jgi:hypothetical protein